MNLSGLNHVTLRCRPRDLPALQAFYGDALGLHSGWRPPFPFPGLWMYPAQGSTAAIHIAATLSDDQPLATTAASAVDHVSLTGQGLAASKAKLSALGVAFDQVPVPGADIMQLFLLDPIGVKIELTFVGER
jgi:catechol 2,3-dioxygenase-like lactoylglutathione lyase family enzyme